MNEGLVPAREGFGDCTGTTVKCFPLFNSSMQNFFVKTSTLKVWSYFTFKQVIPCYCLTKNVPHKTMTGAGCLPVCVHCFSKLVSVTCPFPNCHGGDVEVCKWIGSFSHYNGYNNISMLLTMFIRINKNASMYCRITKLILQLMMEYTIYIVTL